MPTKFTVALDAAPLVRDFHRPVDHSGYFISEHVVAPLHRLAGADPIGLRLTDTVAETSTGVWQLVLKDIHWSADTKLLAQKVADRLAAYFAPNGVGRLRGHIITSRAPRIEVLDARTVLVRLAEPMPHLPHLLGLPALSPLPPARVRHLALGAYTWAQTSDGLMMTRNAGRLDLTAAQLPDQVHAVVVPDSAETVRLFDQGRIDMTPTTGMSAATLTQVAARSELRSKPLTVFGHLEFGGSAPRFRRDPETRRVLARSLDRDAVAASARGLLRVHPDASPGSDQWQASGAGVRAALLEAECIVYADFPPNGQVIAQLTAQIEAVHGVRLAVRPATLPEYARLMGSGGFPIAYTLTMPEFDHPAAAIVPWHSNGALSKRAGLRDPLLDALVEQAVAAPSDSEAAPAWDRARLRLAELMPRIPVTQVVAQYLIADRWRDLELTAAGLVDVSGYHRLATRVTAPG